MIDVALYVDGTRMADGSPGDPEDAPTALSGLSITWGRVTTVDQVEPSTCSFDAMDLAGGDAFLGRLYVGAQVQVRAAGTVDAPATLPINADPGFEAVPVGTLPANWTVEAPIDKGTVLVTTAQPHTGARSVELANNGSRFGISTTVRPAAASADPAAWDDLPTAQLGEHWDVALWWKAPVHCEVTVYPAGFAAPSAPYEFLQGGVRTVSDGDVWRSITVHSVITAPFVGHWIGLYLFVTFPSWQTSTGTWADQPNTWAEAGKMYIDDQEILAPNTAAVVHRDVVVFDGRVTEVDAGWDDAIPGVVCSVVAADFTADLANRDIGAAPWPAESIAARFAHIVAAAGVSIPYTIAPTLAGQTVSWQDVDAQSCWPLLADLATTVDGVLWSATHATSGPYLYLADPAVLSALYSLELVGGKVVIVATAAADAGIELDACDVLLDPVVFRQATSDVVTRAVIGWLEQTLDDKGQPAPTERTVTVIDAPLELALGVRRISITTQLTSAAAAQLLADRVLARLHRQSWRVAGLTWATALSDMDSDAVSRALDLLDGTRRLAAPVILTNLPAWSPAGSTVPLFLQGGTYTFEDGAWSLDLVTASAQSQGTSLAWAELDAGWSWTEFDPAIAWDDLIGVTV